MLTGAAQGGRTCKLVDRRLWEGVLIGRLSRLVLVLRRGSGQLSLQLLVLLPLLLLQGRRRTNQQQTAEKQHSATRWRHWVPLVSGETRSTVTFREKQGRLWLGAQTKSAPWCSHHVYITVSVLLPVQPSAVSVCTAAAAAAASALLPSGCSSMPRCCGPSPWH